MLRSPRVPRRRPAWLLLVVVAHSGWPGRRSNNLCHATAEATPAREPCPGHRIDSLVMEGGGVKGAVYGGAVLALDEAGLLQHIRNFAGTSAGSFMAAMLAVGYTACEAQSELERTPFRDLLEFPFKPTLSKAIAGIAPFDVTKQLVTGKGL